MNNNSEIDLLDRKIIAALQQNARITITDLSKKVGLSKTPCQLRLKRLEAHSIIKGYHAQIDSSMIGEGHIAFVQVTLNNTRSSALDAFNAAVREINAIEECHMIASNFDYLLKIRSRDIKHYRSLLGEQISSLPHVAQTSTFVVMESVKE
jgi:Lrp/AsnC family leucine-responsive transcriptional regulator